MDDVKIGEILEQGDDETCQVPFMEDVVASPITAPSTRVRGILLAALAYFVLPLDAMPDFLAFVGFSDDVAMLTAALAAIRAHITPAHYIAAREALADKEPAEV